MPLRGIRGRLPRQRLLLPDCFRCFAAGESVLIPSFEIHLVGLSEMACRIRMLSRLLVLGSLLSFPIAAQTPAPANTSETARLDPAMAASKATEANVEWHDITQWGVEGRAWTDQERLRWFDRFPAAAEKRVTQAVWRLSRDS